MVKRGKCINIFEENKKNLNLYQLSILIILLITSIQIGSNSIKYAQLNDYISNNSYKQNPQEEVVNDLQDENSYLDICVLYLDFVLFLYIFFLYISETKLTVYP